MIKCANCGLELDDDTDLCPNCGKNLDSSEKVQELKEDSSKKCPSCGSIIAEDAFICPECGNKIAEVKISKKCPSCGAELDMDAQFCDSCGSNLNSIITQVKDDGNSVQSTPIDFNEAISNINYAKLGVFSFISLIVAIVLSLIFLSILWDNTTYGNYQWLPWGFYLAILISVGFFATYQKNIVEGGILGLIVGLILGLLESSIGGMILPTAMGYEYAFGSNTLGFLIVAIIIGVIANLFLRERFTEYLNLHQYF